MMYNSDNLNITQHARERAKERIGWDADALDRMAKKAIDCGLTHQDAKGMLRKYMTSLYFDYKKANNLRVYGEHVFIFNGNTLITIYHLPQNLRKLANSLKTKTK